MVSVVFAKASDEFENLSVEFEKASSKKQVSRVYFEQAVASSKRCV